MFFGGASLTGVVRLVTLILASATLVAPQVFGIPTATFSQFMSSHLGEGGLKFLEDIFTGQGIRTPQGNRAAKVKNSWSEDEYNFLKKKNISQLYFAQKSIVLLKEGRSDDYCSPEWEDEETGSISHIVCDFKAANKTPVVLVHPEESATDPDAPTTAIYLNARSMYLVDICNTVSVKNSKLLFYRSGKACQPTVIIDDSLSTVPLKDHFHSLIVVGGRFSDMKIETVSLELNNLTARILDITQKSSGLESYMSLSDVAAVAGIGIANTKLKSIRGKITELFRMANTTVSYIKEPGLNIQTEFHQDQSHINNCSFGLIMEDGIQLTQSVLHITNTKFAQGNRKAFTLRDNSVLILQNVSFVRGEHGMVVTDKDAIVRFHNVTVGGELIDHRSQFVNYRYRKLDVNVDLAENTSECLVTNQTANCDFAAVLNEISLNSHDDHPDLRVTLRNAAMVRAVVTCPKSIAITNVTGAFYGYNDCPSPPNITATRSELSLFMFTVNVLTVTDSDVKVIPFSKLHAIGLMNFTDTEFTVLEFVVSDPGAESSVWRKTTVHFMEDSYTAKPLLIQDSAIINPVGELTYDHPNQTSTLQNVLFDFEFRGINVKSGTLEVDGLHINQLYENGKTIFSLTKGAVLVVKNITFAHLPREKMLVMTDTENQIEFGSEAMRTLFEERVLVLHVDKVYPYRVSGDSPHCNESHLYSQMVSNVNCDYSYVHQSDVLLGHVPVKRLQTTVRVGNASSLTVRDACIRRITLFNISSVDMRGQTLKCSPEFEAQQVNFTGIYDEFDSFAARNFSSPYIISGAYTDSTDFELDHANIGAILALHGRNIVIENSRIANVTRLIARRKIKVTTSSFSVFNSNAFKIDKFSQVTFSNSSVGFIKRQAIFTAGTLNIANTTIDGLQNHSFVLLPNSVTKFTNVDIGYAVGNPFVCSTGAHLIFNNVTLGGEQELTISHNIIVKGEDRNGKLTLSVNVPRYHPEDETSTEEDDIDRFMASVYNDNSSDFRYDVARLQIDHQYSMNKNEVKFEKNIKPADETESNDTKQIETHAEGDVSKLNDTVDLSTKKGKTMVEAQRKNSTTTSAWVKSRDGTKLIRRTNVSVRVALVSDDSGYSGYQVAVMAAASSICSLLLIILALYQRQLRTAVLHLARMIMPSPRVAAEPFAQEDQLSQVIANQHQLQDLQEMEAASC